MNVFENWLVHQLFRGDFKFTQVHYNQNQVNLQKYATGKELKLHRLTWLGQMSETFGCRVCPFSSCKQTKEERIF